METKCKTVSARRTGKYKKLPARGQTCLPDLADKCWYMLRSFKFYINTIKSLASAIGASEISAELIFYVHKVCVFDEVTCLVWQARPKSYLPEWKFACLGQAVISNAAQNLRYSYFDNFARCSRPHNCRWMCCRHLDRFRHFDTTRRHSYRCGLTNKQAKNTAGAANRSMSNKSLLMYWLTSAEHKICNK